MSVVVKGMRMPEDCRECRFQDYVFTTGVTWCGANCVVLARNFEAIGFDGRPEWCPLIDLGKHGDLIDRDALRAKFPEPKDMIDPQQALVHITGVWAEIDCADVVIEAEEE